MRTDTSAPLTTRRLPSAAHRRALTEPDRAGALVLDFQPPICQDSVSAVEATGLCFIVAVRADQAGRVAGAPYSRAPEL